MGPSLVRGRRLGAGGKIDDRRSHDRGRLQLDVVADAVDELQRRPRDRLRERPCSTRRHHAALRSREDAHGARDPPEERERLDRIGRKHTPVPAEPPAAGHRLERAFRDRLQLGCVQLRRRDTPGQPRLQRGALLDRLRAGTRAVGERGVLLRPVALDVDRDDAANALVARGGGEGDVPAQRVAGDGDTLELERVEQRHEVSLVVGVAVAVAVVTEAVASQVGRDDAEACKQRHDSQPVAEVAGETVQEDDGWAVPVIEVSAAVRAAILRPGRQECDIASYALNDRAVAKARKLIESRWGDVEPTAPDENAFLESHYWDDYAEWHLGLTEGAADETKARYAFVYGDFRRIHRTGLIACVYRASEWRHKDVELAAHDLLQYLDKKTGLEPTARA